MDVFTPFGLRAHRHAQGIVSVQALDVSRVDIWYVPAHGESGETYCHMAATPSSRGPSSLQLQGSAIARAVRRGLHRSGDQSTRARVRLFGSTTRAINAHALRIPCPTEAAPTPASVTPTRPVRTRWEVRPRTTSDLLLPRPTSRTALAAKRTGFTLLTVRAHSCRTKHRTAATFRAHNLHHLRWTRMMTSVLTSTQKL